MSDEGPDEGPTKAAMRDVTLAKSRHLRPPQDRHRSTSRAFENTMRQGIRVNCLVPGGVASGQNNAFSDKYAERVPMGRMARADEVVPALVYLASDASSYVTGQVLAVDGGWTAW